MRFFVHRSHRRRALRLFPIAALLEFRPCARGSFTVGNQTDRRQAVNEHLGRVELRRDAKLRRGIVERVLVVPVLGCSTREGGRAGDGGQVLGVCVSLTNEQRGILIHQIYSYEKTESQTNNLKRGALFYTLLERVLIYFSEVVDPQEGR